MADGFPPGSSFVADHQPGASAEEDDTTYTKVFVGGLPWGTETDGLRAHFSQYGEIIEAAVIRDRVSGRSKGYGFVTFFDVANAEAAVADGHPMIDGRKANCNLAAFGRKTDLSADEKPRRRNNRGNKGKGNSRAGDMHHHGRGGPLFYPPYMQQQQQQQQYMSAYGSYHPQMYQQQMYYQQQMAMAQMGYQQGGMAGRAGMTAMGGMPGVMQPAMMQPMGGSPESSPVAPAMAGYAPGGYYVQQPGMDMATGHMMQPMAMQAGMQQFVYVAAAQPGTQYALPPQGMTPVEMPEEASGSHDHGNAVPGQGQGSDDTSEPEGFAHPVRSLLELPTDESSAADVQADSEYSVSTGRKSSLDNADIDGPHEFEGPERPDEPSQ